MTERRLAAILMADAVDFSSRASRNERSALAELSACMEILQRTANLSGGRVVKTLGDGLMVEFPSSVSAVSAAASMQEALIERDCVAGYSLPFRIGVHVGDVAIAGDDLLGDGVNLAARLEAGAEPRGVLISERLYEDVRGKVDLVFQDEGSRHLKGQNSPVHVYSLVLSARPVSTSAPELPDKPSVAVLPFKNLSSDPEQEFFADGLVEDIITGLAAVPWLFVIARNSSFVYKGSAVDVRKVGQDLGVAYVLEGSVRRAGQRLRVTGQLIDAATGKHIWAERMDGALEDVFDLQDAVTEAVIRAIAPEIQLAEIERARAKRPESLSAYDHMLHGLAALNRAENAQAQAHLERAIAVAPGYGKALAVRAWTSTLEIAWQGKSDYERIRSEGLDFARRAIDAGPSDPETVAYAGYSLAFFGADVTGGIALVREAARSSPSFYWAHSSLGMLQGLHEDDPEGTIDLIDRTMRLSPKDPLLFRDLIAKAHCLRQMERFEEQLVVISDARRLNQNISVTRINMIIALYSLGRLEDARVEWRRLKEWKPRFSIDGFLAHSSKFKSAYGHNSLVEPALREISGEKPVS